MNDRLEALQRRLADYPTLPLMERPTPLQHLAHLSEDLAVDLWLKRDDLTTLGLGGDKPRKLEYELAQAVERGADVIVTCGSAQSNHARLTSSACRRLGLDVVLVLSNDEHAQTQGNLLTVRLMGGEVILVDTNDHWDLQRDVEAVMERLRSEGRIPHFVPISGTTPHSCLGYVDGAIELIQQLEAASVTPEAVYTPFGTGGIFAAYLLTLRLAGFDGSVVGISVNRPTAQCLELLDTWWEALVELLAVTAEPGRGQFLIDDGYVGDRYGHATEECLAAIEAMARREGILLDPVYSGKVFAGLMGHVGEGTLRPGTTTVMLHSGGVPATFAYHEEIAGFLERSRDPHRGAEPGR